MAHALRLTGVFLFDAAAPYADIPVPVESEWSVDVGTSSTKANKAFVYETDSIAASGTLDMDLSSVLGPTGSAFSPEYLLALVVKCITPGGKGTLTPHATNGWTGLGSAYSVPVSTGPMCVTSDGGIAITSTNKVMTLTNTSSAAAKFRIYALMRDT